MRPKALLLLLFLPIPAVAQPTIGTVLNGASYNEMLAPGCWMVIYGTNLAGLLLPPQPFLSPRCWAEHR